jgi:hypothetical protein
MICSSVSRKEIRSLMVGQTGIYTLPNYKAIESARVQFATVKKLESMDFERVDIKDIDKDVLTAEGLIMDEETLAKMTPMRREYEEEKRSKTIAYRRVK